MKLIKIRMLMAMSTLILALLLSGLIACLPVAMSHTPAWNIPTYAYLTVTPNPIGVGQTAFLSFFLDKTPPTANAQFGDRFEGFKVTVTKPDGATEDLPLGGQSRSDAVGGSWASYTPTSVGSYTFVFSYPGQTIKGENPSGTGQGIAYIGDYFMPSTSAPITLTVTNEQVQNPPSVPLPTGYWARPIPAMNLEWYKLAGNWLGLSAVSFGATGVYNASGNFNPYSKGPNTAHVIWTKPYSFGGIIGGDFGGRQDGSNFMSTSQYEPKFAPIVINGVLYYNIFGGSIQNPNGWVAVDIRTGQQLWNKSTTEFLRCGQILGYTSPNQYGAIPYLWAIPQNATGFGYRGSMYYSMYDAWTGDYILKIVDAVPVQMTVDERGNLIGYFVNSTDNTLNMWNSTRAILLSQAPSYYGATSENAWFWRPPTGASVPFSQGIQWKKPLVTEMTGNDGNPYNIAPALGITKIGSNVLLMTSTPLVAGYSWNPGWIVEAGYSAVDGSKLWGPVNRTQTPWTRVSIGATAMDGIYTEFNLEEQTWMGYSLYTGEKLWGPTEPYTNDTYGYYAQSNIAAYGKIFQSDLGGYVHAFDAKTGAALWTFYTGDSGLETPYGEYPLLHIDAVADGKLYVMGGHVYSPPLFSGSNLWCLDANTGEAIWKMYNFPITNGPACALADGYLIEPNAYDNQLYCYGMGQSKTTVSGPITAEPLGSSILIQGTVTDQSPGQTSIGVPAAGTPAIADKDQTAWMQYLYMQQPKPNDATGVPVKLTATDANGNTVNIGTVTSNADGKFGLKWTPNTEGTYYIKATFEGTNSYFASEGTTYLIIGTAENNNDDSNNGLSDSSIIFIAIAAVALIIAVIAVLFAVRKRA